MLDDLSEYRAKQRALYLERKRREEEQRLAATSGTATLVRNRTTPSTVTTGAATRRAAPLGAVTTTTVTKRVVVADTDGLARRLQEEEDEKYARQLAAQEQFASPGGMRPPEPQVTEALLPPQTTMTRNLLNPLAPAPLPPTAMTHTNYTAGGSPSPAVTLPYVGTVIRPMQGFTGLSATVSPSRSPAAKSNPTPAVYPSYSTSTNWQAGLRPQLRSNNLVAHLQQQGGQSPYSGSSRPSYINTPSPVATSNDDGESSLERRQLQETLARSRRDK